MKKLLSLILILCMLVACFAACGTDPSVKDTDPVTDPPVSDTDPTDSESDPVESDPVESESNPVESDSTPAESDPPETEPVDTTIGKLQVGYAKVDITPAYSVPLAGYGGSSQRWSEESDESTSIYATAIAFKDANGKLAVTITVDGLHITDEEPNYTYSNIMRRLSTIDGISEENVIISATHCHSAPDFFSSGESVIRTKYNPEFYKKILNVVKEAIADCKETDIYVGSAKMARMTFVRRYFAANGSFVGTQWNNPLPAVRHESEADDIMQIVKFEREGKNDLVIVNWSTHPNSIEDNNALSGDFIYYMRKYVENTLKCDFAFFQGASGNTSMSSRIEGEDYGLNTENYGKQLGQMLGNALRKDENFTKIPSNVLIKNNMADLDVNYVNCKYDPSIPEEMQKITAASEIASAFLINQISAGEANGRAQAAGFSSVYECMQIRGAYSRIENGPKTCAFRLVAISMGELSFASAPYEMFCQNGVAIREGSEAEMTFVLTHANGTHGYIPSEEVYDNLGYESVVCSFEKGSAERIQAKIIEMINKNYQ